MALRLLVLLLWSSIVTAATKSNVYYVRPDYKNSCPPHQVCEKLSHYISRPDKYFTSDTTFIFLEGQHSFDGNVHVKKVRNLALKGQGQWPVAGPEETVMQSTVILKCTKGKGGFQFSSSHKITVEGLTIVKCGNKIAVFYFFKVDHLTFHKNSIQRMTGYGLNVVHCNDVTITGCSFYHSLKCNSPHKDPWGHYPLIGGGVGIIYKHGSVQHSNAFTLELSYSNITKCCSSHYGGGINLVIKKGFGAVTTLLFSHLKLFKNRADFGGGMAMEIHQDNEPVLVRISYCFFFQGHASFGGGIYSNILSSAKVTIQNSNFVENSGAHVSEISVKCLSTSILRANLTVLILNSIIEHTKSPSITGVIFTGFFTMVNVVNTRMTFANQNATGFFFDCNPPSSCILKMSYSQIKNSHNVPLLLHMSHNGEATFANCKFLNNTGGHSVISISRLNNFLISAFINCIISDNNMTGMTLFGSGTKFVGQNVIQNNRYYEGAGITLVQPSFLLVYGKLILHNNTADKHGGGILVKQLQLILSSKFYEIPPCSIRFINNSSSIVFSGNTAQQGGSDIYNAKLMGCNELASFRYYSSILSIPHVGHRNETSWYFKIPSLFMKHLHFSDTDGLSSMSSDPVMVCFCNTTTNLPDCSDRKSYLQTYSGVEFNTTIATVGYYGGTSPGAVQVSAQHARLVRYYGQTETTKCFTLNILLQNSSSTTALVDIRVQGVVQGLSASIMVEILPCPIGFSEILGQCQCEQFLANGNVQCNVSMSPFRFLRSGNSWFGYINNTQCVTGTTNCPLDYCNQSNVSFDIMAPDRQCSGDRTGILCGQCQSHLSIMLGSNRCGTCSNWYLFLLPVFGLAGIVLVAVLMYLNLSVSVGTINGLLFYANMVKLNEAFFFPNGNVPVVSQFISWLNLDLGIEVCLFDGLDGYWNTWLQFAFPAYLFLLMGGVVVGCHYSMWFCRLCGSHAVPALATLFLMSYTKILLIVTSALSISPLPCNGSILTVWSVDGNIEYGSGKHLILVAISCGILLVGLAYPVLLLCVPLLERYSHKCIPHHRWNPVAKFKPLFDAYGGPYKDKYRFWTGVTLIVRLIATLTFSFTSGKLSIINAFIITAVVMAIFAFWFFANGVYKNIYLSSLEAFYLLNLFFLSSVSLGFAFFTLEDNQVIATIVSVTLSSIACLVTMVIHLKWNFDFEKIKRKLGFDNCPTYEALPQVTAGDDDDEEDTPPPGSPPSIVYGSRRGQHQFILEFPRSAEEQESSSPVLLDREPLLMFTDTNS